uniref:Uncharacterized protein n=1 Tax=Oryza punctata TaxID=4537 RepID=A0A0E0LAP4_ORYPU
MEATTCVPSLLNLIPKNTIQAKAVDLGLQIRTIRGLVLVHGDLVDNSHLLEHGEQLHLRHVLGHLSHELLHDFLLYSSQTSTNSHGGMETTAPSMPGIPPRTTSHRRRLRAHESGSQRESGGEGEEIKERIIL